MTQQQVDTGLYIEQLKAQRNTYADAAALAGAAVEQIQADNAKQRREIEVLTKALEVLKGKPQLAAVEG